MSERATYDVRPVRPDEWERLRAIRLEMLRDTPEAYITTLDEALAFPDDVWIDRAVKGAAGEDQSTLIAVDGTDTVGMAVGLLPRPFRPDVAPVVSVYVAPRARRSGVGTRLMGAVEAWAKSVGAHATSLWVVDGNDPARSFYDSLGYRATLDRQKISIPPVRWETRMVKALSD